MNPITVKMFDASQGMIVTRFLDMCITTGICIFYTDVCGEYVAECT